MMMVFPKNGAALSKGDYVRVLVERATQATLIGHIVD
jgi:hypothetical protein